MKTQHTRAGGFTLIELMITIAVVGVLTALVLPSFTKLLKNNCMTTTTNNLVTSLQLAKSEAVKRRATVRVEAIDIDPSNPNTYKSHDEWDKVGWRVKGPDITSTATPKPTETIRVVELGCGSDYISIDGTGGAQATSGVASVSYDPSGYTELSGFNVCDSDKEVKDRQINLNSLGRPSTESNFTCP